MAKLTTQAAAYDLDALYRVFHSAAHAIAVQAHTRIEWKTYRDSAFINLAYTVMPWKGRPGTAEVIQYQDRIDKMTAERTAAYLSAFLRKMGNDGPAVASQYAHNIVNLREVAKKDLQGLLREARLINAEISGEAAIAVERFATIQLGSTLILKGVACYLSMGTATPAIALGSNAISLGYDIVGAFIKDGMSVEAANSIGIELGKTATGEVANKYVANHASKANGVITAQETILSDARKQIADLNEEIARKTSSSKIAKLNRAVVKQTGKIVQAEKTVATQTTQKAAGKAIAQRLLPLIFLGHDIYGAWGDYQKAVGSNR